MNICFSHTPPFHLHLSLGIYVRTYLCLQKRKINYYDSYLICICWQTSLPMCSRVFITYIHTYIHTPLKCLYQAPSLVNNNNDTVNNKKGFRIFFFFHSFYIWFILFRYIDTALFICLLLLLLLLLLPPPPQFVRIDCLLFEKKAYIWNVTIYYLFITILVVLLSLLFMIVYPIFYICVHNNHFFFFCLYSLPVEYNKKTVRE